MISHKEDIELLNELPSTSELAFGLMSSILRNIPSGFDDVKNGDHGTQLIDAIYGASVGF